MGGRIILTEEQRKGSAEGRLRKKAERIALATLSVDALLADQTPGHQIPAWAMAHLQKARKGNLRSAVAAKCADCAGYQREEVRNCTVTGCPLWAFRPYQAQAAPGEEGPAEVND